MRLPYAPSAPPTDADAETVSVYEAIAARRRPRPLIPLDLTLLQSPPVAAGYNAFVGALRSSTTVPEAQLELAICRVGVLNEAVYEWNVHAVLAIKAGMKPEIMKFAMTASRDDVKEEIAAVKEQTSITDQDKSVWQECLAILQYTDEVTKDVKVQDETFAALKASFNDRQAVELTSAIAGYNCVSRILVSLDVGENNGKEMKSVEEIVQSLS